MELRSYQQELITKLRQSYLKGKSNPCIVSPCGSGKSVITATLAKMTAAKGNRVLFLIHRKELADQIEDTFRWVGVDMELVQIGMVQTVVRRLAKTEKPALIITDESHHVLANSYRKIYSHFPQARKVGFTATPVRLNGGGLGEVNDDLIIGPTVAELIEWGNLSPFRYYAPEVIDTSKLKVRRGEFVQEDIEEMFVKKAIWGDVVNHYQKLSDGKQAICYCSSIAQSEKMADVFKAAGITAEHIDGTTPKGERSEVIKRFREGKTMILCNMDLLGEGLDVPDCNTAILLRPTQSLSLHIQQSMRCMRYKSGKTAIIIDHVGNVGRHGTPDMDRIWSLEPKPEKKQQKDDVPIKQCAECFYVYSPTVAACPECGHEPVKEVKEVEQIDSELVEITSTGITMDFREPEDCKSIGELHTLARNKGYKAGWVYYQAKQRGWL